MLFGYDIGVISGAILFIKKEFLSFRGPGGSRCQLGSAGVARRRGRRRNPGRPPWTPEIIDYHRGGFRFGRYRGGSRAGHGVADYRAGSSPAPPSASLRLSHRSTFPRLPRSTSVESSFRSIKSLSPAALSSPISSTTPLPGPRRGAGCLRWRWSRRPHLESD